MNKTNNPLAFPSVTTNGMTLRDYFAAHALAMLAHRDIIDDAKIVAKSSYEYADAMLAQREVTNG